MLNSIGWNVGSTVYGGFVATYMYYLKDEIYALRYAITSTVLMWFIPLVVWILMYKLYPKYTTRLE